MRFSNDENVSNVIIIHSNINYIITIAHNADYSIAIVITYTVINSNLSKIRNVYTKTPAFTLKRSSLITRAIKLKPIIILGYIPMKKVIKKHGINGQYLRIADLHRVCNLLHS